MPIASSNPRTRYSPYPAEYESTVENDVGNETITAHRSESRDREGENEARFASQVFLYVCANSSLPSFFGSFSNPSSAHRGDEIPQFPPSLSRSSRSRFNPGLNFPFSLDRLPPPHTPSRQPQRFWTNDAHFAPSTSFRFPSSTIDLPPELNSTGFPQRRLLDFDGQTHRTHSYFYAYSPTEVTADRCSKIREITSPSKVEVPGERYGPSICVCGRGHSQENIEDYDLERILRTYDDEEIDVNLEVFEDEPVVLTPAGEVYYHKYELSDDNTSLLDASGDPDERDSGALDLDLGPDNEVSTSPLSLTVTPLRHLFPLGLVDKSESRMLWNRETSDQEAAFQGLEAISTSTPSLTAVTPSGHLFPLELVDGSESGRLSGGNSDQGARALQGLKRRNSTVVAERAVKRARRGRAKAVGRTERGTQGGSSIVSGESQSQPQSVRCGQKRRIAPKGARDARVPVA
ncbi:hypothetical protein E1B28_009669 [Marasmius oreades]|uniref:Uncharacterized protein n=1 Tax=Marasmius oreades TaxID=181124 RepID=A0A9P7RWN2_9AGAR|nr:uncharacterized protein E1B28_009669 [Marasmius oreades]KAG7090561.1 hypothetical protein E1B28_009669 [Marasmius oreades]